jgi:alpha-L-fucosidase
MQSPNDKTQTYQYHLKTYGANSNYDDFFANFTDKAFDPQEWVNLFADAGAQYFVPTTSAYLLHWPGRRPQGRRGFLFLT